MCCSTSATATLCAPDGRRPEPLPAQRTEKGTSRNGKRGHPEETAAVTLSSFRITAEVPRRITYCRSAAATATAPVHCTAPLDAVAVRCIGGLCGGSCRSTGRIAALGTTAWRRPQIVPATCAAAVSQASSTDQQRSQQPWRGAE